MNFLELTRAQVREVDRRAIEDYGIPGVVLMENAGRNASAMIDDRFAGGRAAEARRVAIVCGGGNNGGDGFVIARHLSNAGWTVEVFLAADPGRLPHDGATNYRIAQKMGLPLTPCQTTEEIAAAAGRFSGIDVIVDALLGTGFSGAPRPPLNAVIEAINASRGPAVVAIDVPSGLDCDTGTAAGACVRAHLTITFVAMKRGFRLSGASDFTGEVQVADIGAPRRLIQDVFAGVASG